MLLDGSQVYRPANTKYLRQGIDVGTPSVRTGPTKDVYLTLERGAAPGDTTATIRVFVKPLILWLWIGGAVMALGTLLAAFPGSRRRRPTDPVSAPVAGDRELVEVAARDPSVPRRAVRRPGRRRRASPGCSSCCRVPSRRPTRRRRRR